MTFDQAAEAAKAVVLPKLKTKLDAAIMSMLGRGPAGIITPVVWRVVEKGVNILLDELKPRMTIEGDGVIVGRVDIG